MMMVVVVVVTVWRVRVWLVRNMYAQSEMASVISLHQQQCSALTTTWVVFPPTGSTAQGFYLGFNFRGITQKQGSLPSPASLSPSPPPPPPPPFHPLPAPPLPLEVGPLKTS